MASLLALDLAKKSGFAHGGVDDVPQAGSVQFGRGGSSMAATLAECRRWLQSFLLEHPEIEIVVFEAPLTPQMMAGRTNINTVRQLIGLCAVVEELLFTLTGFDVREARVSDVRTHFLGSNRFKRDDAKNRTINQCHRLGWKAIDHDAADALALWHYQASILEPRRALETNPLFRRGL